MNLALIVVALALAAPCASVLAA
ncbi:MAG: hypothetical protein RL153_877, partial [Verrucomicrobiota bacterium]